MATFVQAIQVLFKALGAGAVSRSLQDKSGDLISVKDFGAVGNGTTDDRGSFNSANGVSASRIVPAGTYRIGSNVTLGGTWRFSAGAVLKPDSGKVVTFDGSAVIYSEASYFDTSAGGSFSYSAGATKRSTMPGTSGKTDNIINGFAGNQIASDVSISVIAGGGNVGSEQLIGYSEKLDRITGDGVTTVFTTSYDEVPANILLTLIRADKVRVTLTSGQFGAVVSGTKVQVTYPLPGHFVNDGTGGAEGSNPAVLATQQLYIASSQKTPVAGSGCDYSTILGGYDDVISQGVRQCVEGAHHRVVGTGNHCTIVGGSYNRNSGSGTYGGIFGGSSNEDAAGGSGTFIAGFGNLVSGTGPGTAIGSTHSVSGAFAAALGGTNLTVSGNGSSAVGRNSTVSGADSFAAGNTQTVSAPFSAAVGFTNSLTSSTGYSFAAGRQNSSTGAYGSVVGFSNSITADYANAKGKHALAALSFSDVIGGEQIAALGDNQTSTIVARRQTTNATATELRLGAATARLTIPSNTSWAFSILVTARQVGGTTSAAWKLEGVLKNDAGTVALVGTVTKTILGKDAGASAWDAGAAADNTNKALSLTGTGAAATTINWVARIELAEIAG